MNLLRRWRRYDETNESQTAALLAEEGWKELERFWVKEYGEAYVGESSA